MSIGRICNRVVETARPSETVATAARRMLEQNVGSLVVQDDDGRMVGIVTDRDLMLDVLAQDRNGQSTCVEEVMAECVQSIREDATIEEALATMRDRKIRRLPVVDARGGLVGIVALDDVLALIAEEFGAIGSVLEAETPRKLLGHAIPLSVSPEVAPSIRPTTGGPARARSDLGNIEHTLSDIRDSLDVMACALSIGLEVRLLGGGVIEGDVRQAADRCLRRILGRDDANKG